MKICRLRVCVIINKRSFESFTCMGIVLEHLTVTFVSDFITFPFQQINLNPRQSVSLGGQAVLVRTTSPRLGAFQVQW